MSGYYAPPPGAPPPGRYTSQGAPPYGGYPPQSGYPPYGGPPHGGPPAPAGVFNPPKPNDESMWAWFLAVDADRSGKITAAELHQAPQNSDGTLFDISTVEMLIKLFDSDHSGTITFHEFKGIFTYVHEWGRIYRHCDRNHSGSIDSKELHEGLTLFGFPLSQHLVDLLVRRYAPGHAGNQTVTLDQFMRICVVVKSLHEYFQAYFQAHFQPRNPRDEWIQLNYEQTLGILLNAPRY